MPSSDVYVDTEPANYRCYRCGQVTRFVFVHGKYVCTKCKSTTLTGEDGAERFGQLKEPDREETGS